MLVVRAKHGIPKRLSTHRALTHLRKLGGPTLGTWHLHTSHAFWPTFLPSFLPTFTQDLASHAFRLWRRFEEAAGVRHPAVKATMRAADAALEVLTPEQRAQVASVRPNYESTIACVVAALTDELGAYQQGSPTTKVQRWDSEGVALIGPLS